MALMRAVAGIPRRWPSGHAVILPDIRLLGMAQALLSHFHLELSATRPKKKAKALPIEDLERIVAQLASSGTLKAVRDNALLQTGFFEGLRRSELVAIEVGYVGWATEGTEIMLPRSKTDQLGAGIVKAIP